ncbi:MAG: NAD(P)/FAD-dependent oxidoreductase [Thermoanaerobaculia bacterium]
MTEGIRSTGGGRLARRYHVVILGGAFSGASAAILLRRELPQLKVLIVEKAERFDEKVGEATTELAAMFLTRRLALWEHLRTNHLPKEGLRYWFGNEKVSRHAEATESGGDLRSAVPSFQLRRDVLDEHLLATAVREGADLLRPARVTDVRIGEFDHEVSVESGDGTISISCDWVLDASGRANIVGRKLGLIERNEAHPVAAMWGRWRKVRDIDDIAAREGGEFAARNVGSRRLATNHYMGRGYWVWVIPLGNGETSIGVVWDRRLVGLHESGHRKADYVTFLTAIPALRELLAGAEMRAEDLRFYSHLAYSTKEYMGKGWALLGDAAVFLDPYYSPGLDHAAFSIEATVEIIRKWAEEEDVSRSIAEHNATFIRSYRRFFEAVYRGKYFYMGEADLVTASFLLDTAHYYIFVVIPAYRIFKRFHWMPVLGPAGAFFSYRLMRLYNRRFVALAERRRRTGSEGRRNHGRRIRAWFDLRFGPMWMLLRGLKLWLYAELDGVRLRFRRNTEPDEVRGEEEIEARG